MRGTNAGWKLSVSLSDFTAEERQNKILKGVKLIFFGGNLVYSGEDEAKPELASQILSLEPDISTYVPVMTAETSGNFAKGAGATSVFWGSQTDIDTDQQQIDNGDLEGPVNNKAIQLNVPGKYAKDAKQYKATLTWQLNNTPNENIH